MGKTDKLLNGRKVNECVIFATTGSNQMLKEKTHYWGN
jgi:hypothetical protein